MVMVVDDLQRIISDLKTEPFANRKSVTGLLIVSGGLLVIVVALSVALGVASYTVTQWNWLYGGDRCATPDCLRTAAWIADSVNIDSSGAINTSATRVDPCDDFYRFACGTWESRHFIPPDDSEVTLVEQIEIGIADRLRNLIERGVAPRNRSASATPPSPSSGSLKLGYFYSSCMHDYGRMANAGKELVEMIGSTVGPWYVFDPSGWAGDDATTRQWDIQDALVNARMHVAIFHETFIDKDRINGGHIMLMKYAGVGLPWYVHYLQEDKSTIREAYKDYMRQVAILLLRDANITIDSSETRRRVEQFVSDAYGQEEQIALILQQVRLAGGLYARQRTTIGELNNDFPQLNWLRYVRAIFDDQSVEEDKPVIIEAPLYFRLVDDMLRNESEAHIRKRVINNYIVWRLAFMYAPELSSDYREAGVRFRQAAFGFTYMPSTWRMCLETAKMRLGSLIAWLYAKAHLAPEVKPQVTKLFNTTRATVIQRIRELSWMDDVTKSRAIEKISTVELVVGFGDMYYDDNLMEQTHSTLDIVKSQSYLKNILAIRRWQRSQRIRLFFIEPPVSWHQHLPIIGWSSLWAIWPYYNYYTHTLIVPVGALTEPLFETARTDVFNYALLGSEIAYTLLNNVGERGRVTWTNGTYVPWWTNSSLSEYRKTNECFKKYFDGLTIGPFLIDGKLISIPVNVQTQSYRAPAEHGGIKAGLRAYKDRMKSGRDALPVGLNMSPEQLYFISVAQKYCFLRTDEARYRDAQKRITPEDFELNTLLAHMPEFTDTFKCSVGTKMRTSYQCEVF